MTQKQVIGIAKRLGAIADYKDIDEKTRRECVDAIETVINTAGGFNQVKGGYVTGKVSLAEWRKLARTDQRMDASVKAD